jgi:hypothetical protein
MLGLDLVAGEMLSWKGVEWHWMGWLLCGLIGIFVDLHCRCYLFSFCYSILASECFTCTVGLSGRRVSERVLH